MTTLAHCALAYASQGLAVLPLVPGGKTPLNAHGCSEASTDEATIWAWWERCPEAGIGLVPGPRFWVLDVDTHPPVVTESKRRGRELIDGFEAIRRMAAAGYEIPPTRTATTPKGGLHLWWRCPPGIEMRPSQRAVMRGALAGLDVRGVASYVVAPPTRTVEGPKTVDGVYRWTDTRKAVEAPTWLLRLMLREDEAPVKAPVRPPPSGMEQDARKRRWAEAVLEGCCARIASASSARHATWYAQAVMAGGVLWGVDYERARTALEEAARGTVKGRRAEIRRTVADGLEAGRARPVWPEER